MPVNAAYVCHREFIDLAKVANGDETTVTSQFVTEDAYLTTAKNALKNYGNNDFIKRFCVQMPDT